MLEKSLLILNVCFLCFGILAYVQGITTKEKPVEAIKYTPIIEEVLTMDILLKKYPCIKYPVFEYSKLKNGKIVVKGKAEISIWNEEKEILAVVDLMNNRVNHCRIGGRLWKKSYTHNFTPFNCLIMGVGESEESE